MFFIQRVFYHLRKVFWNFYKCRKPEDPSVYFDNWPIIQKIFSNKHF
jgi:hypothetical protein